MKNAVNSISLVQSSNVFEGDKSKPVKIKYLLIDKDGQGDAASPKGYIDTLMDLLHEKGIGETLEKLIHADGVKATDDPFDMELSNWFSDHAKEVEELAKKHGYRVLEVLR